MPGPSEPFVPEDFSAPTALDHPDFRLRVLGPEHNERDHAAWTGSIEHIRSTPGYPYGSWPEPMSLEANLEDLRRHRDDFDRRIGFTYTVLAPDGHEDDAEVIGCVYLYPDAETESQAVVRSWVRADHAHLDGVLADALRGWVDEVWPWRPEQVRHHPR